LGHSFNKENSEKLVLVHLLAEIINYTKMHGEYKVKFSSDAFLVLQHPKHRNVKKTVTIKAAFFNVIINVH
jgi:hypothetical protein